MAGSKNGSGASKQAATTKKAAAKKSDGSKSSAKRSTAKAAKPGKKGLDAAVLEAETSVGADEIDATTDSVPVRVGEDPWTVAEVRELRSELERDIRRAEADLATAAEDLAGLIWDAGDGSGDDQADAGAKTYEREQELSLANISRDKLEQSRHALLRLDEGRYGTCENCGEPIGKFRLQAAPRATLCRSCKEKTERA